jgi:hypothetical protein
MADETIYASGGDNILDGITPTGTAPSTTYSLATLALMQPAARVRWGATGISLVFTLGSAARGDVLVIPVHNLDEGGGSPASVLTLTNGAGLSVTVPVPADQANGQASTIVLDLTEAEPNPTTRTASVWTLTIAGNSANVTLGGAVAIFGPKRVLNPDLRWGFSLQEQAGRSQTINAHLVRYIVNFRTTERSIVASIRTSDLEGVRAWFQENAAGTAPGLLWTQLAGHDAYLGIWEPTFHATNIEGTEYYDIDLTFTELSKGKPV